MSKHVLPKCVIISAPSGAGKTTMVRHLLKCGLNLEFSISATSRGMRPGEKNGRDYYFLSSDEFRKKIEQDEFLEWEEVYDDHCYGTLKSEVDRIWKKGNHVIFDVDVYGGLNIKKYFGDRALAVFIMPPDPRHLAERLQNRGTEDPSMLKMRLAKAEQEMSIAGEFDRIIINDHLRRAQAELEQIVRDYLES